MNVIQENLSFGAAIDAMKAGSLVSRFGWNGKGMYLYLLRIEGMSPCIAMRTAKGDIQPGWLASQPDILGEDWQVVTP